MLRGFSRRSFVVAGVAGGVLLVACGSGDSSSTFGSGSDAGADAGGDGGGFNTGGDGGGSIGSGAPTTCIVGSKGCLCDSTGGCAPGLTCTPQTAPAPSLCCNGTDCAPSGGTIGKSCSAVS